MGKTSSMELVSRNARRWATPEAGVVATTGGGLAPMRDDAFERVGGAGALSAIKVLGNFGGGLSAFNLFGKAVSVITSRGAPPPDGVPACLLGAFQADPHPETIHDMDRCGAAVVTFAAVMTGPEAVRRLLRYIDSFVSVERRPLLDEVEAALDSGQGLTTRLVRYLQDLLFDRNNGPWGTSPDEFERLVKGVGFEVDHEAFGSTADRIRGLEAGEMIGISIVRQGRGLLSAGHIMLLGRSESGELYFLDSGISALTLTHGHTYVSERSHPAMFSRYLELATGPTGRNFGGFKFRALSPGRAAAGGARPRALLP